MELGSYIILDSNEYTKQELLDDKLFILKMMALEKSRNSDELYSNLQEITQKKIEKSNRDILMRVIKYIYKNTLGEGKTKDIIEKLSSGGDKEMIIEIINKDREMQFQKGEKLGISKAITQMVKEMLQKQMSDKDIMDIAKIDKKKLEKLKMV